MLRVDHEDFEGNINYAADETCGVADKADKFWLLIGGYNYDTSGDPMRNGNIGTDLKAENYEIIS